MHHSHSNVTITDPNPPPPPRGLVVIAPANVFKATSDIFMPILGFYRGGDDNRVSDAAISRKTLERTPDKPPASANSSSLCILSLKQKFRPNVHSVIQSMSGRVVFQRSVARAIKKKKKLNCWDLEIISVFISASIGRRINLKRYLVSPPTHPHTHTHTHTHTHILWHGSFILSSGGIMTNGGVFWALVWRLNSIWGEIMCLVLTIVPNWIFTKI